MCVCVYVRHIHNVYNSRHTFTYVYYIRRHCIIFPSEQHLYSMKRMLADIGVSWHFIPTSYSHFGGLREGGSGEIDSLY
jgi:hypothetical protein